MRNEQKSTKEKSFPSVIILKDYFKPYTFCSSPLNQFPAIKKRKFGNTLCSSQSTNHGLYLTQSSIELGKRKVKKK
jgi:hypothetical protein